MHAGKNKMKKRRFMLILGMLLALFLSGAKTGAEAASGALEDGLEDGEYSVSLEMEGGSGKASITSPTLMTVEDGQSFAHLEWSSPNYDYMLVDGKKYINVAEEGANSSFEIPILCWDEKMPVIADTTAMGTPHEIEYTLIFYSDSVGSKGQLPQEAAKRVVAMSLVIIVGGGILDYYVKKKRR